MTTARKILATLLRLILRRLDGVEVEVSQQTKLLGEIRALLVRVHDRQEELHGRLIEQADRSGERARQIERRLSVLERRPA